MKIIKESIYSDVYKPLKASPKKKKKENAILSPIYKDPEKSVKMINVALNTGNPSGEQAISEGFDITPVEELEDVLGITLSSDQINYLKSGWNVFYKNPNDWKDTVAVDLILHAFDMAGLQNDESEEN